ncbi:hypothetical protein [Falsiroseomonas tokyonensis]|uniref:Uncharacterized protein n=1 Tax=Falsiroseomonas tokyonensis TaxID=430521 RepID=A0ABV7C092_9PROT|nr:hypothetical protein [Falsiroseomonas tokyonensis]MBU8540517.1 hypothetical protein [Falsiroseomonas tokyonensis]
MTTRIENPDDPRGLLGLRPPAELAEGMLPPRAAPPATDGGAGLSRPHYPTVSSGWDEEESGSGARSSLVTALLAGGVLLAAMVMLGLLIG